jgi:hypothetical protein
LLAYASPPPFAVVNVSASSTWGRVGVSSVSVDLLYTGGYYLYGVDLTLIPCSGSVVSSNPVHMGWLSPGQELTVTYLVNSTVPVDCESTVRISWGAQYQRYSNYYYQVDGSGSADVPLELIIRGEPALIFMANTTNLLGNLPNPITLIVVNNGSGSVYNLRISINPVNAAALGNTTVYVSSLGPGSSYAVPLLVTPNVGAYLAITYSGLGEDFSGISGSYNVYFNVIQVSGDLSVFSANTTLSSGMGRLVLGVVNPNPVPLSGASLVINGAAGLLLLNSTVNLGKLAPGSVTYAPLIVMVPTNPGSASITYTLLFHYPNGYSSSVSGVLTLSLVGSPRLLLTNYLVAPSVVYVGNVTTVSVTFTNSGSTPAYNVNVTCLGSPGLSPLSTRSIFYGQLDPQMLNTAAFTLNATTPGNQSITIIMSYMDQFGINHEVNYVIPVSVLKAPIGTGSRGEARFGSVYPLVIVGSLALVIVILTLVLAGRRG